MAAAILRTRHIGLHLQPFRVIDALSTHLPVYPQLQSLFTPRRMSSLQLPTIAGTFSDLGSIFSDLWGAILKAVPKKKTTHSRKRARQLAGKALKDVEKIVPCPSCGRPKRPHVLCEHCVSLVKQMWTGKFDEFKAKAKAKDGSEAQALESPDMSATKDQGSAPSATNP